MILGAAGVSAAAVGGLSASPRTSAFALPTVRPHQFAAPRLSGSITGPLDGETTPRARAQRRAIAAIIDNFTGARPQSGISRASLVFEAPVEQGITRLMPIFLEHDVATLGPVRSARPYFVDWAAPYHPLFVHDGGSPAAESILRKMKGVEDVDAATTGTVYHRTGGAAPPHNLFTGTPAIRTLARARGWTSSTSIPASWSWRQARPSGKRERGQRVTLRFGATGGVTSPEYDVGYRYDPGSNSYLRTAGGVPAVDSLTGKEIEAANVVVIFTAINLIPNDPLYRLTIRTTGSGKAVVLTGGHLVQATWKKTSSGAPLRLQVAGHAAPMAPGTTWIEVVSPGSLREG